MARIVLNPAIQIISGDVGGFIYRQQADGTLILAKQRLPDPDREPTEAQAQQLQRFKEASARYTRLMENSGTQAAYQQLMTERGIKYSVRALVMGDIMGAPKIDTIDLSHYQGAVGDSIRVLAEDSVGVSRLTLSVYDTTASQVVESGEKAFTSQIASTVEWEYTVTVAVPADHAIEVRVAAYDLAGNQIEKNAAMQH
jgi:hypothetical protein